jgi:hypothetical protein
MELRQWHRWLTLVLLVQLTIWIATALSMTLVPRSATIAYRFAADTSFDAAAQWPDLDAIRTTVSGQSVEALTLYREGLVAQLDVDNGAQSPLVWSADASGPARRLSAEAIVAHAAALTGEPVTLADIRLKTRNSPEYQKLPLPVWRVEAERAVLFFDPETGALRTQTPFWRLFENWVTTIHVMDYTGNAQFRGNLVLTGFAVIFVLSAGLGLLAVRRVHVVQGGGLRALRWHQALGLILSVQVLFWASSGLGVVWVLHPLRDQAHAQYADDPPMLALDQVAIHPADIAGEAGFTAARIRLTQLLGQPVYQFTAAGRTPEQALFSARTGDRITLTEEDRDQIARERLDPAVYEALGAWETASGPAELDFYFYTGPWPVWKARFDEPLAGGVAIDQTTGFVHTPRTGREIFLERYYNVHVVNWRFGVVRYRREPALLAVIFLAAGMLATGFFLQLRRWRRKRR